MEETRISHIAVKGLFGLYHHSITLRLDDRVTILHGPNGVGKTVLLHMIDGFFGARYSEFLKIPFKIFEVTRTDGLCARVEKMLETSTTNKKATPPVVVRITLAESEAEAFDYSLSSDLAMDLAKRLESEMPWFDLVGPDSWLDSNTSSLLSSAEFVATYVDRLPSRFRPDTLTEPKWLKDFRGETRVYLIETQRLLQFSRPTDRAAYVGRQSFTMVSTVRNYAKELQRTISQNLANYASRSQSLDQTFPQRLLSRVPDQSDTVIDLKREIAALDVRRQELMNTGLLDDNVTNPIDPQSLDASDATQQKVLRLYVRDTAEKLSVLEDLSRRLALLSQIVNGKFRHKKLHSTREGGLNVVGDFGGPVDLDSLSSGEQHELVLTYDMLFRVDRNALVLIDEPELSLHLSWQRKVLADILSIVEATQFDVILATHSPFIAGDRVDLMVPLGDDLES